MLVHLASLNRSRSGRAAALLVPILAAWPALAQETQKGGETPRQEESREPAPAEEERWNLFWQATSIGQAHGAFRAPYTGPNSLESRTEADASITTTLFLGLRLSPSTQLYFNPEIAGGKGFSNVTGIANSPNGEIPRVGSATPRPYLARLYITQD